MPGPRRDFGPKQKVENPVKVFKRIMSYVLKRYPVHCLFVLICIIECICKCTGNYVYEDFD
jgi:ATP-binding cassette subfamily B multidrug efflux pump